MSPARILVIEDEPDLRKLLRVLLERAGHEVEDCGDGRTGIRAFHEHPVDLVLLDLGLSGLTGWEVLERLREMSNAPIVVLTAKELEQEKVRGLNAGADDYMTKPFGREEPIARINAVLRRSGGSDRTDQRVFHDARLDLDFATRSVRWDGAAIMLTPAEYRVLAALVRHAGTVLSAEQLLEQAWGDPLGVAPGRVQVRRPPAPAQARRGSPRFADRGGSRIRLPVQPGRIGR